MLIERLGSCAAVPLLSQIELSNDAYFLCCIFTIEKCFYFHVCTNNCFCVLYPNTTNILQFTFLNEWTSSRFFSWSNTVFFSLIPQDGIFQADQEGNLRMSAHDLDGQIPIPPAPSIVRPPWKQKQTYVTDNLSFGHFFTTSYRSTQP